MQESKPGETPALSGFRVGLLVLLVATAAWRWWTSSHWSWFADDWFYLEETQWMGFLEYVFQSYNSHLMPGQFLLTWVLTAAAPLDYGWAALTLTLFSVASVIAWALALREMFGERARLLFPLALMALSPLLLLPGIWWASGIQILPMQLCMGLCVLFLARYVLRGGRRSDMVRLLVSYGLGLFFWQKALLVMIPLALVAWVLLPGPPRDRLLSCVRVLALPTLLSAVYAAVYLSTRRVGVLEIPRTEFGVRTLGDWQRFVSASATDVALPTLFGGPYQRLTDAWDVYDPLPPALALGLTALLVVVVAAALALRRHSALAIACLLAYVAVNWGLMVSSARFLDAGSERTGRYSADIVPVAALVIALLTTRTVVEDRGAALRKVLPARWSALGGGALVLIAVGVTMTMAVANVTTWSTARENSPRHWLDAVVADSRRAGDATIANALAPSQVLDPVLYMKYAELKHMLGPLDLPLRFDEPSELMLVADADGHLKHADVVNHAAANAPPPEGRCGFLVKPGGTTKIPLTGALYPWGWAVRLDYFSDEPTEAILTTDNVVTPLSLEEGLNSVQLKLVDSVGKFSVSIPPGGEPVCVTQVFIGDFAASPHSPWK